MYMEQHRTSYAALDLVGLAQKKGRIVSSEEALKEVESPSWSDEVLSGKKKVTIDLRKKEK